MGDKPQLIVTQPGEQVLSLIGLDSTTAGRLVLLQAAAKLCDRLRARSGFGSGQQPRQP